MADLFTIPAAQFNQACEAALIALRLMKDPEGLKMWAPHSDPDVMRRAMLGMMIGITGLPIMVDDTALVPRIGPQRRRGDAA